MITCFKGRHDVLSNFFEFPFTWLGRPFRSTEHAYCHTKAVAAEDEDAANDVISGKLSAAQAKHRTRHLRPEGWDRRKGTLMAQLVRAKFHQCGAYRQALLAAGDLIAEAVPGNSPSVLFWSAGLEEAELRRTPVLDWPGANRMGHIHMTLRDEVRNNPARMSAPHDQPSPPPLMTLAVRPPTQLLPSPTRPPTNSPVPSLLSMPLRSRAVSGS